MKNKNRKIDVNAEDLISKIKGKYGKGYFISNIKGMGCYFYYDFSRSYYDILFTSPRLKAKDLRFLFERNGRKVTESAKNKDHNLILRPFSAYIEPNLLYEPDDSDIYRVEEHQIEHINNQARILERSGLINNFKDNSIRLKAKIKR